jgi:hypothetical protein
MNSTGSFVHMSRMRRRYSSVTLPRSVKGGAWSVSNSSFIQPTPAPRIRRPPDITSSVASILAVTTGLRYGTTSTLVPIFTREVSPTSTPIIASGSR